MKSKENVIMGAVLVVDCIILLIIRLLAIGKTDVAGYERYAIGGFGGFLILEGLIIPFCVGTGLAVTIGVVLIYRVVKAKKQ